jgi:large subunit ribosomal protein L10
LDRKEKEEVVANLKEGLGRAYGAFVVDYQGLNVEALTKLRRELTAADIEFQVVKNRLLLIACQETQTAILKDYIVGPCALAITYDDVITPAKLLTRFSQDCEALKVKIGQVNGRIIELPAIKRLAQLPAREVLLAQLIFSLSSVPISFVGTLSEMLRRLVNVLEAIKRHKA